MSYTPTAVTINKKSRALFGDGSDGNVTISVDTTLTRDMYYNNLTVDSGKNLDTACFRVFIKGTLSLSGTIRNNGASTTTQSAGTNIASQVLSAGNNGAVGGLNSGTTIGVLNGNIAGSGGNGGSGSAGVGGTGGTISPPSGIIGAKGILFSLPLIFFGRTAQGVLLTAGNSGGSGGGNGTTRGGGSGAGGNGIILVAKTITGSGTIQSLGGNGANGPNTNTGGGGGAGGGYIILLLEDVLPGTITLDVSPGTGGAGNGTGTAGTSGSAGQTFITYTNG
jgi:hypothetical protein